MIPDTYDYLAQDIERVVDYSQGWNFNLPGTKELIRRWKVCKGRFYDLFGEKLIWQSPDKVTIELTESMQDDMFEAFLSEAARTLTDLGYESEAEDFTLWLQDNKMGFFANRVLEPFPDTEMKVGSKLLKSFKYFFDGQVLRQMQDLASRFIQQSKIEGYICVSIHPIDYLTASENNSNWRSCHALDGEYRAGNLSYMLDPSTIICYLRPAGDVQLANMPNGFLWNDKKWRMYLSINATEEIAFFSRQYPFECSYLAEYVKTKTPISKLNFGALRAEGFKKIVLGDGTEVEMDHNYLLNRFNNVIIDTKEICQGDKHALNYNDIIDSPSYTPIFATKKDRYYIERKAPIEKYKTKIGESVPCLCGCGRLIDDSNMFLSDFCYGRLIDGLVGYCVECGTEIYEGDDYKQLNDWDLICGYCADEMKKEI